MNGKNFTLLVFIASVLVFLFVISGKRALPLPDDALHANASDAASCLQ